MTAPERIWATEDGFGDNWWSMQEYDGATEYVRADLAAAQPAQVRVKPLVWTTRSGAPTAFGTYIVTYEDHDGVAVWFVLFGGKPLARCGEHSTEDAAKAAAQADYEARILAAIEPQPDPRDEVIKGLVDALVTVNGITEASFPQTTSAGDVAEIQKVARAALAAAKAVQHG